MEVGYIWWGYFMFVPVCFAICQAFQRYSSSPSNRWSLYCCHHFIQQEDLRVTLGFNAPNGRDSTACDNAAGNL